ncbi:alpha-L-rhamnosidase N-terminal domain-containing protein [Cohnella zeiphila]|uniref:Alpha-L-rhamnosidase N-terminal domain-containing protein n=1 Tax=Cohnella zeiphila TaxID=2761120 RepID=A0A7X0SJZ1_9BACL|nr:alpha-L-rhamnosidase N-terminal domain-containing protein [Cohnella zeiphila]MBB6731367.1 alpha-L-rhamnosidase N-terminal domain-containing protein [Cohnella zeiphila]
MTDKIEFGNTGAPVAVWCDEYGQGRNPYARFRLTLDLADEAEAATLHLFANTAYMLYVNGEYAQTGSIRFDPRYPVYDTHEIGGLLRHGRNAIAVLVNYVGHKTFTTMPSQAGFAAWGEAKLAGGAKLDFKTGKANWKAASAPAFRYSPKSSLFLKAADHYDQRLDEPDWQGPDFDDGAWLPAIGLADQKAWGRPEPRAIPFMSGVPVPVESVQVLPLARFEDRYSFSVPMPHVNEIHEPDRTSTFIAFMTWIYAPEETVVTAGLFYQDTWINGEPVAAGVPSADLSMRVNHRFRLRKGWNHYFGKADALQDMYHHQLALPAGQGLVVSADRDSETGVRFRRSPVLSHEQFIALRGKPFPYSPEDPLAEAGGWAEVTGDEAGESPILETGWDLYGEPFEKAEPDARQGRTFRLADYPEGFALLFDLGMTRLVRPCVVLEGAGGATVDLTYSEHLNADGKHLRHFHWYGLGDRAYADETRNELIWRLTQPRGGRYVLLTVRGPKQDVRLARLELASASYPAERKGFFRCSDPLLEQIWEMGVRTEAVNMEDAYTDCVTRERGQYIRDTIIQYHNNLAIFGDQALMRRCLQLIGQSADDTGKFRAVYPNTGDYTIADFSLNALEGFDAYYRQTGDAEHIESHWEAILRNLAWFHELADERDDLLLDAEWDVKRGVKAHYGGFHGDLAIVPGYMDTTGVHCVFSCTYLIALRCAARLADAIGRQDDRRELERRISILESSVRETFWDEERGCYADNEMKRTFSVHASLFAARAGVLTDDQLRLVRRHVEGGLKSLFVNGYGPEDGVYVSPSFSFYIFEGLYLLGLTGTAERMMRQGWGWFLQKGLKQTPEYFNLEQSLCHAWSACPTYFLSRHVLGVRLPDTGRPDEVVIRVETEDLTAAEGAVPHRLGLIEVKWHTGDDGRRVFDYVRVPQGLKATIEE